MTRLAAFLVAVALLGLGSCSSEDEAGAKLGETRVPDNINKDAATKPVAVSPTTNDVVASADGAQIGLSLLGRYKDPAFGAAGLPGLSPDGLQIAYGEERLDGGRGHPNFRLVVRATKTDQPLTIKDILSPAKRFRPEDEAVVRGRIDAANQLLATTEWTPMKAMIRSADDVPGVESHGVLRLGDDDIAVRRSALVYRREGKSVLRRPLSSLLKTNAGCPGTPRLTEAYVAPHGGGQRLLVRFEFETDGCWREAEYHALSSG